MSAALKYAMSCAGVITVVLLGLWPFLDSASRSGVFAAAAIAVPVQVVAFAVLNHYRGHLSGFLAAWVGGTFVRMAVIAAVAVVVIRSGTEGAVPMLLALAGFLFGLLMLEPIFFGVEPSESVEA